MPPETNNGSPLMADAGGGAKKGGRPRSSSSGHATNDGYDSFLTFLDSLSGTGMNYDPGADAAPDDVAAAGDKEKPARRFFDALDGKKSQAKEDRRNHASREKSRQWIQQEVAKANRARGKDQAKETKAEARARSSNKPAEARRVLAYEDESGRFYCDADADGERGASQSGDSGEDPLLGVSASVDKESSSAEIAGNEVPEAKSGKGDHGAQGDPPQVVASHGAGAETQRKETKAEARERRAAMRKTRNKRSVPRLSLLGDESGRFFVDEEDARDPKDEATGAARGRDDRGAEADGRIPGRNDRGKAPSGIDKEGASDVSLELDDLSQKSSLGESNDPSVSVLDKAPQSILKSSESIKDREARIRNGRHTTHASSMSTEEKVELERSAHGSMRRLSSVRGALHRMQSKGNIRGHRFNKSEGSTAPGTRKRRAPRNHVQRFKDGNLADSVVVKPSPMIYGSMIAKPFMGKKPADLRPFARSFEHYEMGPGKKPADLRQSLERDVIGPVPTEGECESEASKDNGRPELSGKERGSLTLLNDGSTLKGGSVTYPPTLTSLRHSSTPSLEGDEADEEEREQEEASAATPEGAARAVRVSPLHDWCGWFFGWTPFRRYSRKKANSIEMMDHQYFIPPREEGETFFDSFWYTYHEYSIDLVIWVYQSSWFAMFACYFVIYLSMVFIFAGVVVALEYRTDGTCGLEGFESIKNISYYELAYELSWSTFTTVGFGKVHTGGGRECWGLRFSCSIFAFVGLLFNSLSAAITFSKLERVLTRASVSFCSSACLQFGESALGGKRAGDGVYGRFWMNDSTHRSLYDIDSSEKSFDGDDPPRERRSRGSHSFPFLEFRLVNDHANYKNRTVYAARINAMVQLSQEDADNMNGPKKRGLQGLGKSNPTFCEYVTFAPKETTDGNESLGSSNTSARMRRGVLPGSEASPSATEKGLVSGAMVVQEADNDAGKAEGRVYYPLNLEPDEHPYFKRVWYFRYTLNAKSPLLNESVRKKIMRDGQWNVRKYQDVLAGLVDFHRIRITFKGTSAVSNSLIFAQKIYSMQDLYVGWQFGQIFYKNDRWSWFHRLLPYRTPLKECVDDNDDDLMLDKRLIHNILPQQGGGQEPLEGHL